MHLENVKVVYFFPGRLRLSVPELKGHAEEAEMMRNKLLVIPGITTVDADASSGAVLIKYDRKTLKQPESIAIMRTVMAELFPSLNLDEAAKWLARL